MRQSSYKAIVAATMFCASIAHAESIRLNSKDGTVSIEGQFLRNDSDFYYVNTIVGELAIRISEVICEGASCPRIKPDTVRFIVAGPEFNLKVLSMVIEEHAKENGLRYTWNDFSRRRTIIIKDIEEHEVAIYDFEAMDTSQSFIKLFEEPNVIAVTDREPTNSEMKAFFSVGRGDIGSADWQTNLGHAGVQVIVSTENDISSLKISDVRSILKNEISDWEKLGTRSGGIQIARLPNDSLASTALANFFDAIPADILHADSLEISDEFALSAMVDDNPSMISYRAFSDTEAAKAVTLESECGILHYPDNFEMRSGVYPLNAPISVVTDPDHSAEDGYFQSLRKFIKSSKPDGMLWENGIFGHQVTRSDILREGQRLALAVQAGIRTNPDNVLKLAETALSLTRLSTTIRFSIGSSNIEPRGIADLEALAEYLSDSPNIKSVYIIGFTDSIGKSNLNAALSLKRAESIKSEILNIAPELSSNIQFFTEGMGEISPVGCNTSQLGRQMNRRVEIWIEEN